MPDNRSKFPLCNFSAHSGILASKKLYILIFLCFITSASFGQVRPILYGGFDYFRDTGFENNSYNSFNVGAQLFQWKFIAPEAGYEHYFGIAEEKSLLNPADPNAMPPAKLKTSFSTNTFSLAPKLIFGNREASIVLIPQYNFGKIRSRGDLLIDGGDQYLLEDQQRFTENISFWSFAAGVEGQFFDSDLLHFGLFLKYNFLNSKDILREINFQGSGIRSTGGSTEGLGLGFRMYFDFIPLLSKNRLD